MSTYERMRPAAGITALLALFFGAVLLLSPSSVRAIWPFSSAQAAEGGTPVLHDPASLHLLAAAINSDPNPTKGGGDISLSEGSALLPNAGPEGVLPAQSSLSSGTTPSNGTISVYTVAEGDSISSIAARFGVSVNTILWANDLTTRSTIRPGATLVILPVSGVTHTVKAGETLSTIAASYGASSGEIATFNGLDADATVVVGSDLIIPGGEEKTSPTPIASKGTKTSSTKTSTKTTTKTTTSKTRSDLGSAVSTSGYFSNPVPGALLTQGIHGNNGVDLGAPSGTPIHAAAGGTVIISKDSGWNGGYGSYVVVRHSNGTQTLYSHMSQDIVSVGETVEQGDVLGYVGETGEATGNHLHFEVRGGKNPFGYSCSVMAKCY